MISYAIDPRNVPIKIPIIAHDVGRSHDRSTAVVGGHCAPFFGPQLLLVQDFNELPLGIYGSQLANELAKVDQKFNRDCLIVADLSSDPTYAEVLLEMFGPRVIGVQIGRLGDGMTFAAPGDQARHDAGLQCRPHLSCSTTCSANSETI